MGTRPRLLLAVLLIATASLASTFAHAQKTREPLTEGEVMRLLQGGVAPQRVGKLARESGIGFEMNPAVERDLRSAGADDQLLQTLREQAPGKGPAKPKNETPKTGALATTGILLITVDAACKLAVDGEDAGEIAAGASKRLTLPFGEHLIRAVSTEQPAASVEWTGKVEKPEQALVRLALADKVAALKDKSAPASATAAQAEVVFWKSIENSTRVEDFRAYIQKYPDGTFSTLALARIEKLEADAKAIETDKKRMGEEAARQAEIRKYTFPVAHLHARMTFSSNPGCFGHLRITPDGASYEGGEGNAFLSKNDVTFIDIAKTGIADFLRLHTSSGNWSFTAIDEADVQNRKFDRYYPPARLGNAIVERWGFVSADKGKRLVPPNRGDAPEDSRRR